jgi:hypothetical protein
MLYFLANLGRDKFSKKRVHDSSVKLSEYNSSWPAATEARHELLDLILKSAEFHQSFIPSIALLHLGREAI